MKWNTGMPYLACGFILAGTSIIAAHFVDGKLGAFTITAASIIFALPVLLAACGKGLTAHIRSMKGADWVMVLLQAVFGVFLFRLFLLKGLERTSAAEAGILTGATPATTALLAGLVLREPIGRLRAAGIACTVGGIVLLQGGSSLGQPLSAGHLAGNLLVLLAALSETAFNILSRVGFTRGGTAKTSAKPACQTALVMTAALLLCLVPAALERPAAALAALGDSGWLALAWYGLFASALAYICWYSGIKRCDATVAAAFSGLMPLTAAALSVLLLGERPSAPQWAGALLVAVGMLFCGYMKKTTVKKAQIQTNEIR